MSPASDATFGPGVAAWPRELSLPAGEGPRTALPVHDGIPRHLDAHLERLRAGAEALDCEVPWLTLAAADLFDWIKARPPAEGALRLSLHLDLRLLAARLEPLPPAPFPCRLTPMPHPMGDLRPSPLARHKGLSGPWRPVVLAEARRLGADDALLLWPDGTLAETAIAAVALECDGFLTLPPYAGRVASVAERLDLPAWAEARGWTLRIAPLLPGDCAAGRLWCLNALRGLWLATLL